MAKLSAVKEGLKVLYMEDGKEISDIIIYGKGKVLYESNQPYIDIIKDNLVYSSTEITLIGDIKRANKVNYNRKDNYYIVDKNKCFSDKSYTLYIHESEIKINSVSEKAISSFKDVINYKEIFNVTLKGNIKYKVYDGHLRHYITHVENNVNITHRFYTKSVITEYGKKLKEIETFFKNNKVNISKYDIEKLINEKDKLIELL